MSLVTVPVPIRLKDTVINLNEDNIAIYQWQVNEIRKIARTKTLQEWMNLKSGIKIELTSGQQRDILSIKDQVIQVLSPSKDPVEILSRSSGFGFTHHAYERVLTRVERVTEEELEMLGDNYGAIINPETLEKIVDSLINSNKVLKNAEWKARPYFNFNFVCEFDERIFEISVNFEFGILIVTMILKKDANYFVREVYRIENDKAIKKPSPYR